MLPSSSQLSNLLTPFTFLLKKKFRTCHSAIGCTVHFWPLPLARTQSWVVKLKQILSLTLQGSKRAVKMYVIHASPAFSLKSIYIGLEEMWQSRGWPYGIMVSPQRLLSIGLHLANHVNTSLSLSSCLSILLPLDFSVQGILLIMNQIRGSTLVAKILCSLCMKIYQLQPWEPLVFLKPWCYWE